MSDLLVVPDLRVTLEAKIDVIRTFIREGCGEPEIGDLARGILCQAGAFRVDVGDPLSVAAAFFTWQQAAIPFEADPLTGEVADIGGGVQIQGPVDMVPNVAAVLARGRADCVGQTVLLGSLLCARGIPLRLGLQDIKGQGIDHVLLMVGIPADGPQEWIPVDLTTDAPGRTRPGSGIETVGL